MKRVFVDADYWIAIIDPHDQWHTSAKAAYVRLGAVPRVTTEGVLTEVLTHFCSGGPHLRSTAAKQVRAILNDANVAVMPQSRESFKGGLGMYEQRPDKKYSLTDCISMCTMRAEGITEVLSHDRHFQQEGFQVLMRDQEGDGQGAMDFGDR